MNMGNGPCGHDGYAFGRYNETNSSTGLFGHDGDAFGHDGYAFGLYQTE